MRPNSSVSEVINMQKFSTQPKSVFVLLIASLMLAGCGGGTIDLNRISSMIQKTKVLAGTDESGEIKLGRDVSATLLGAAKLSANATLQAKVNRMGRWLSLQTERPKLAWYFGVLESDSINAFAAPGGYIFITRGLVEKLGDDSELAAVLAHEISHVLKRHHLEAMEKAAKVGLIGDFIHIANRKNKDQKNYDKLVNAGRELYTRGLDKEYEFEADRMGVVIATRAGYDPYGQLAVLQTLEAMNPKDSSLALMFKTHPSPTDRIGKLSKSMDKSGAF